jgi:hypothetical protein
VENLKLDIEALNKRAKAKFSQGPLIDALINLPASELKNKYKDTFHCASVLVQNGDKITSRYCKNRFCKICNRIKTGQLINEYADELDNFSQKTFVTLTIPNVKGGQLRDTIKQMNATIRKIQDARRKAKKILITGIRKLECTYNVNLNNYHPHFHFIIDGAEIGSELIESWLKYYPGANKAAQETKPATECKELFKYFTKLTYNAGKTFANGSKVKDEWHYPEAIDVIFTAIQGLRIIQPMGGFTKIANDENIETDEIETIDELESLQVDGETLGVVDNDIYIYNGVNWFSPYTGVLLSSFKPDIHLQKFSKKIRYLQNKNTS